MCSKCASFSFLPDYYSTDLCMSRPMRGVNIILQIKGASHLSACNEEGKLAITELASMAEDQIVSNFPSSLSDCSIINLEQTSCEAFGMLDAVAVSGKNDDVIVG